MSKTTIQLEDDLETLLANVAQRQGRSQAELVREALQQYLGEQVLREEKGAQLSLGAGEDATGYGGSRPHQPSLGKPLSLALDTSAVLAFLNRS